MGYPSGAMAHRPTLILASTSRYRRALLERLRVPFEVAAPPWSEVYLSDPDTTVSANALGKARSVAAERPDAVILGSDQVAWCDGQIIEKPGTPEAACSQLALLAGREHALYTCVALRMPDGREREETVVANLRMRPLSSEQIASYVQIDSPLDCAGSYKIEGYGIVLFDSLRCEDPTAIEGLPLISTWHLLEEAGFDCPPVAGREP